MRRAPSPEYACQSKALQRPCLNLKVGLGGVFRNRLVITGGCMLALLVLAAVPAPLWVTAHLLRDPVRQFPTGLDEDGMPVIVGMVMFSAVIVVAANLVVDVLYRWIDPRIKAGA